MISKTGSRRKRSLRQALPSVITARLDRALSQKEAAALVGVRQGTFARWENGMREPGRQDAAKIAKAFSIPLSVIEAEIRVNFA